MQTTVTTSPLTGGTTYRFKVRAHNIHGWGLWSDEVSEITSGLPDTPSPLNVHIVNLDVNFSWTAPNSNFAAIIAYQITIGQSDGSTFTEQIQYCNGQSSNIVAQSYCLVPETVLRLPPYSLTFDTPITATVRALNRNGWSQMSAINSKNGVDDIIQIEPSQMQAPYEGLLTNESQVQVQW